ncbi:hypothetical protein B1no1_29140 [Thermolongibacillus altinsuensis]|nr:hypothetical protein B1no1_29140 [Thermolongibacillus altinsuensis]
MSFGENGQCRKILFGFVRFNRGELEVFHRHNRGGLHFGGNYVVKSILTRVK